MDDQLLRDFLAEAEELIEALFADLQALRAQRAEGRARREIIARLFRHVHTIKGTTSALEVEAASQVAHGFETLLDGVRLGRVAVDDAVLDAFDDGAAAIAQILYATARGEAQSSPLIIERLRHLALKGATVESPVASRAFAALPADLASSLGEHEKHRLHAATGEGARLFLINMSFDLANFDESFRNLSDALAEDGEIISTLPGLIEAASDQINFRIVYAAEANSEEVAALASQFGTVALTELAGGETGRDGSDAAEIDGEPPFAPPLPATIAPLTTFVRVELSELDEAISAAHDLLKDAMGALDLTRSGNPTRADDVADVETRAAHIRRRFVELEERLISLRMIPVAQIFGRALRAGTVAARATGKEVDFETFGGEVRLDKSLADTISDPLLHILRNAIDHGIETPAERVVAGKSVRGRVRLEAVSEGSRVLLRVSDDGRGIDPERIARAAAEHGIIDQNKTLTKEQSLRLIFRPGFSTAPSVSSLSGRGVGLNVVETVVEQVGGEVHVQSEAGSGSTFEIALPTTFAVVSTLIVRSAGHSYGIDADCIAEMESIAAHEVERAGEVEVIHWRNEVVPLVRMRKLLAQPPCENPVGDRIPIVLTYPGGRADEKTDGHTPGRIALAVDGCEGRHDVLVRGLGRHGARWQGVSGAAELLDGTVALMLDLSRLLEVTEDAKHET